MILIADRQVPQEEQVDSIKRTFHSKCYEKWASNAVRFSRELNYFSDRHLGSDGPQVRGSAPMSDRHLRRML